MFLDYNQNAKDRTTCSAYSVRPLPDARVSTPLHWHEVPDCDPAEFTVFTMPERFAKIGDPHAEMDPTAGSLEKLLELADERRSCRARRCALAAAFSQDGKRGASSGALSGEICGEEAARQRCRSSWSRIRLTSRRAGGSRKMESKHAQIAGLLAVDDVLVDSMRGRSSTWTRIRINLRHVPEGSVPCKKLPTLMTIRPGNGESERSEHQRTRKRKSRIS